MKVLLAIVVAAAAVTIGGQMASADPQSPCANGNPTDLCDNTTITVETEPAGANCPNGGVKIVVTTTPAPTPERDDVTTTTTTTNPDPEPVVETFYICNGANGEPGPAGPPGEGGIGLPITVTQDTTVNVNITNGNRRCRSVRERVRLVLPQRMRAEDTVRIKVDRERAISHEVIRDRFVRVNMRGKRCGAHLVQVRKVGIDPSLRLWTVTSATGINKKILVP